MTDLAENLFPDNDEVHTREIPISTPSVEETILTIPGSIVHLIDKQRSVELASGDLSITRLRQGENVVAVLLRVGQEVQWPLAKDEASVKLDQAHYFFSLRVPNTSNYDSGSGSDDEESEKEKVVNYGLTIASKGQEKLLKEFDEVLEKYSSFSVQKVNADGEALNGAVAKEISPVELDKEKGKMEMMEGSSAAYWTTLAPNVEDYSGYVARGIASGSGSLIKGILWCGDVTVDRLKWGNQFLRRRLDPYTKEAELSPGTLRRIKRAKRITKMSEQVALGVLSGVVKVSGFFTGAIVNSAVGKKFFSLMPGEIILASLDGFSRVFDAVEVAGRNVMATTSTVTTDLVTHKYGEKAAGATNEGFDAAGYAIGTAWAVFKIRKALNPKSVVKPTTLAKQAAKAAAESAKAKSKGK